MTQFRKRFTGNSGTVSLMEDLGKALNQNPDMIFMGGGNPAQIPSVEACFAKHWKALTSDATTFHKLVGEYQPPQGDPAFLSILANFLSQQYGWAISADNIAISNGGQSAFFILFNILAGQSAEENNRGKRILLPMSPDYLGYADTGLDASMFCSYRPIIQLLGDDQFKYAIDFDQLQIDDSIAAICLSRPTNPSGNVVTDAELSRLQQLCKQHQIPLIIDSAYGKPFPNVTFVDHQLHWDENTILVFSLSKLGLPGVRTGIVVANENIIKSLSRATASLSLAPSNTGPALCKSLLQSEELLPLTTTSIQPFYHQKMQQTADYLLEKLGAFPVRIHKPEGAFFLWAWFDGLGISSQVLYERLKARGVLVLSGHHFFQALGDDPWEHKHQCLRISYCQPWERIRRGIDIMAEEMAELYDTAAV